MKSSQYLAVVAVATAVTLSAASAHAAGVDMKDPRRALALEDDIRIDAQLLQENVGPNNPVAVTYQVQNLTSHPVAVADRVSDSSYDADSATITISFGSEVPSDGALPHLVIVKPGEKKVLSGAAPVRAMVPNVRAPWTVVPRFVQIKVNVLRDVAPFAELIAAQDRAAVTVSQKLNDDLFEKWIESNDAIFLNTLPVKWQAGSRNGIADASVAGSAGPPGAGRFH